MQMTALTRFSESLTVNNSILFKRSELIKSKGRIEIPSFFAAENLPKPYKERLDERLSEIITEKTNEDNTNEKS